MKISVIKKKTRNAIHYCASAAVALGGGLMSLLGELKKVDFSALGDKGPLIVLCIGLAWLFLHHYLPAHDGEDKKDS